MLCSPRVWLSRLSPCYLITIPLTIFPVLYLSSLGFIQSITEACPSYSPFCPFSYSTHSGHHHFVLWIHGSLSIFLYQKDQRVYVNSIHVNNPFYLLFLKPSLQKQFQLGYFQENTSCLPIRLWNCILLKIIQYWMCELTWWQNLFTAYMYTSNRQALYFKYLTIFSIYTSVKLGMTR